MLKYIKDLKMVNINYFKTYNSEVIRAAEFLDRFLFIGVASGKCGFTTLRAFSPLISRVYSLL